MDIRNNKKLIRESYEEYKKIIYVKCPAFKSERIYFNKRGFRHLIYKNNNRRSDLEYKIRLGLIKYATIIIKDSIRYVKYRKIQSDNRTVHFWSLEKNVNNLDIILIIRQIDSDSKHFFSIMLKK